MLTRATARQGRLPGTKESGRRCSSKKSENRLGRENDVEVAKRKKTQQNHPPTLIFPTSRRHETAELQSVTIDGSSLDLEKVVQVARLNAQVIMDTKAIERIREGRKALERLLEKNEVIYGVNSGFGALSDQKIPREDLKPLQANLIRSHSASVGPAHSSEIVRALMLLRANTLLKG